MRHVFWSWDANFEICHQTASHEIEVFAGCHNVEIFAILPRRRSEVYVPVPNWWGKMEPIRLLVVPSPLSFAYHLNVALHESTDNQANI